MGCVAVPGLPVAHHTGTVLSGAAGHSGNGRRLTRHRMLAGSRGRDWPIAHREGAIYNGKAVKELT